MQGDKNCKITEYVLTSVNLRSIIKSHHPEAVQACRSKVGWNLGRNAKGLAAETPFSWAFPHNPPETPRCYCGVLAAEEIK